jgi:hypothetical protein
MAPRFLESLWPPRVTKLFILPVSANILLKPNLTYSMEQSPNWEANRFSASQDIPRILRNPKVRYRVYNPPPVPVLDTLYLRGWAFSHRCCWRFVSFGMLRRVAWYIVPRFEGGCLYHEGRLVYRWYRYRQTTWSVGDVTIARNGYRFYYSFRTHLPVSIFHMPPAMPT